jgi:hypothetical protein
LFFMELQNMRKPFCGFLFCEMVALFAALSWPGFCAAQMTGEQILYGTQWPASPAVLPDSITLPDSWSPTIREMWANTVRIGHEQGACLYHGRTTSEVTSMTDTMKQINELNTKRTEALAAGDQTLAGQLLDQKNKLYASLTTKAAAPATSSFEIKEVTEGISGSVHVPHCIGSSIGTIHTHPKYDNASGDGLVPLPSDGDFMSGIQDAVVDGQKYQVVIAGDKAVLLVYTAEMLQFKAPNITDADYARLTEVGSLYLTFVHANPYAFDSLLAPAASLASTIGAVMYAGQWPNLHRVAPAATLSSQFVEYRNGQFHLKPASPDANLIGMIKVMLFANSEAETLPFEYLNQSKAAQEFGVSDNDFKIPFTPESFTKAYNIFQKLSEDEKITVLGFGSCRKDIRMIATDEQTAYPVGPCLIDVDQGGRTLHILRSQQNEYSDFRTELIGCKQAPKDANVSWTVTTSMMIFAFGTENGNCRTAAYSFMNGQFGNEISQAH